MKFKEFFNRSTDRDIAERMKRATKISMGDAVRDRMRAHLSEYTKMRPIRETRGAQARINGSFTAFFAHIRPMPIVAALLIISIGSSTVSAESSLPGDLLYPIKVHINEGIRSAITRTPEARIEWAVARAERRLEEAAILELVGNLSEATRAELETNLDAYEQYAQESGQGYAGTGALPELAESVGAIRIARRNILGTLAEGRRAAHVTQAAQAESVGDASTANFTMEAPEASIMSAKAAAPIPEAAPALMAEAMATDIDDEEGPEVRARGNRTAAKVRIGAAERFLEKQKNLDEGTRQEARELLQVAREKFEEADEKSSHGKREDATREFEQALESAMRVGAALSEVRGE